MENKSKRNILILSGLMPDKLKSNILKNSKGNVQFAANSLQYSLIKGLSFYYENLKVINFPFVGGYPTLYRSPLLKAEEDSIDNVKIDSKGFFNISGLKNIFIYKKALNSIRKWAKENDDPKIIFIYSAYLPFIKAALKAKRIDSGNNIKICLILPDLIEYMNAPKNLIYKVFTKYSAPIVRNGLNSIDIFILLSEYMKDRLPIGNKPYVVMEGIYDNDKACEGRVPKIPKEKIILYSGHLAKRYGILNLIGAFSRISIPNIKLVICGDGDSKDEIMKAAKADDRIHFLGVLNHEEVLRIQKNAFLLVNPRTPEGEFTRYSFPSKTLEYLASGVPTLIYRLSGIPDIYYDYCFTLTDPSIDKLKEKIEMILTMETKDLDALGEKAKSFIIENKNPISQCYKIYKLIEEAIQ